MQKIWLVLGGMAIANHLPYFLYTSVRVHFKNILQNLENVIF